MFVNYGCYFDTFSDITVGDDVFIADHVRVLTSTHEIGPPQHRAGPMRSQPVAIGAGSWIGSGVTIMPGVTIGEGCVVGANSLVTRDCKRDALYVGTPAAFIRDLSAELAE